VLFHVHVKDVYAPTTPGEHVNAPYEEGAVPLPETVEALAEVGYDGPVGIEYHPFDRDPTADVARARQLLSGWLAGAAA
jgi:sugar phosphate isomerase/epimerase